MIDIFMSDRGGAVLYSLAFGTYLGAAALSVVLSGITNQKAWNYTAFSMMGWASITLILSLRFSGVGSLTTEQQSMAVRSTILITMLGAAGLVWYATSLLMKQKKK